MLKSPVVADRITEIVISEEQIWICHETRLANTSVHICTLYTANNLLYAEKMASSQTSLFYL